MTTIYLIEVVAYDPAISSTKTLRYCTGTGYVTGPNDTPADTFFEPRVSQPALLQRDIFEDGTTYGASRVAYGELVLKNPDGWLDALIDYGLDGRAITVWIGDDTGHFPGDFTVLFRGTMEQPTFAWKEVSIRIRDRQAELDTALQTTKYSGGNELLNPPTGVEGSTTDIKGKPKPLTYGRVFNITPQFINTAKLVYQVNDGTISDVPAVYDNGKGLNKGTDYTDLNDMMNNAPATTTYRVWKGGGMFRLGSTPVGDITADVVQGAAAANRTVAQLVKTIATTRGKIAAGDVNSSDITALDSIAPAEVGVFVDDETKINAVLDDLCASVGAWWGFDRLGQLRIQRLEEPTGTPIATFTEVEIVSIERQASSDNDKGIPAYRTNLKYFRNWTVQNGTLAGEVTTDRKAFLAEEYRTVNATDTAVQTVHLLAPEMDFETLLISATDAQNEANRRLTLYKKRRDRFTVRVRSDAFTAGLIDLGQVVQLQLLRFGLNSGKLFRIIGIKTDYRLNSIEMTLWG